MVINPTEKDVSVSVGILCCPEKFEEEKSQIQVDYFPPQKLH